MSPVGGQSKVQLLQLEFPAKKKSIIGLKKKKTQSEQLTKVCLVKKTGNMSSSRQRGGKKFDFPHQHHCAHQQVCGMMRNSCHTRKTGPPAPEQAISHVSASTHRQTNFFFFYRAITLRCLNISKYIYIHTHFHLKTATLQTFDGAAAGKQRGSLWSVRFSVSRFWIHLPRQVSSAVLTR